MVLLYVSGNFKQKNSEFVLTKLKEKNLTHPQFTLVFFTFYRCPFRTLGVTLGHKFRLLRAIGVLLHPLWAGFITVKGFLDRQGKRQGILGLQEFITACERQGTRQAQVPCCSNPTRGERNGSIKEKLF